MCSLFTICTFAYERKQLSLLLSSDRVASNLSLRTSNEEMIIFVFGNFWAVRSMKAWKFSKQVSVEDFSMSLVPV